MAPSRKCQKTRRSRMELFGRLILGGGWKRAGGVACRVWARQFEWSATAPKAHYMPSQTLHRSTAPQKHPPKSTHRESSSIRGTQSQASGSDATRRALLLPPLPLECAEEESTWEREAGRAIDARMEAPRDAGAGGGPPPVVVEGMECGGGLGMV